MKLISFGYLHLSPDEDPVDADRVEDLRVRLRDPAAAREILDLDGRHPRVREVVLNTPGARALLDNLVDYALLPTAGPRSIAIGCAGGRHRSVALVETLASVLRSLDRPVEVEHWHVHLPRVLKAASGAR